MKRFWLDIDFPFFIQSPETNDEIGVTVSVEGHFDYIFGEGSDPDYSFKIALGENKDLTDLIKLLSEEQFKNIEKEIDSKVEEFIENTIDDYQANRLEEAI